MGTSASFSHFCPTCKRHYESERTVCPGDGTRLLEVPLTLPRAGNVFDSRYVILETIGKGGMATIYRGYDATLKRTCALKVLKVKFTSEERAVAQFFTEARLARRLAHPNIIRTYDFGRTDVGYLYIAMELLQGQTLSRIVRDRGPLDQSRALRLFSQILGALKAAHDRGTVHRDLKPENIFLCGDGETEQVKLLDFGIAQFSGTTSFSSRDVCGTPAYMSPEQIRGKPPTPASDLYSAGLVLFEMLTGTQVFTGPSPVEILKRQLKMAPPSLVDAAPGLEKVGELWEFAQLLLKKKVKERLGDAGLALESLRKVWPLPEVEVKLASAPAEPVPLPCEGVRVPVFSYQVETAAAQGPAISLGLVPVSSATELEDVLVRQVRPGILLEEGVGIQLDAGDAVPADDQSELPDRTATPTAPAEEPGAVSCSQDTYTLLHVRFVPLDRTEEDPVRAEQLRHELMDDLEPWFGLVERLGGLVCYDSGADLKVLFGYLTDEREYIASALEAAMALSIFVEHLAIRQGRPCGVKIGVATGSVYTDQNVEGPLDWLIRGSEIDFAVRLSRIAPAGGVVMCQTTALHAQPAANVREMASISTRGRHKARVFLLVSMALQHEMPLPVLPRQPVLDPPGPFEYSTPHL